MALLVDNFAAGQRAVAQQSRAGGNRPNGAFRPIPSTGNGQGTNRGDNGSFNPPASSGTYLPPINRNTGSGLSNGVRTPPPTASRVTPTPTQSNATLTTDNRAQINQEVQRLLGTYKPALNAIDDQIALARTTNAARQAEYDNMEGAYKKQLAGQLAEAGLDIRAADIPLQYIPLYQQFLAEHWGNAMTAGKADLDYTAKQQVNSANQRLEEWRTIQQGKKVVERQAGVARRDATSAAVVGGVVQNAKQDYADIDAERGEAIWELDAQDVTSRRQEKERREALSNRRSQLMADLKSFDINTREGQTKLREREQLLQIEAERARMKPAQLMDAMGVTLANLGLDRVMSEGQMLEAIANGTAAQNAQLGQFLREANAYEQFFQRFTVPAPSIPMLGIGGPKKNPNAGKQDYDRGGFR